ncbi:MAG: NRPS condensation-like uncharacterized protein, partial [Mariniblastus sp.]
KRRLGRWLWSLERDTLAVVPNKDETSPSSWDFDLSRETGVRFLLEYKDDNCDLWLQVHHSCADGRGAIAFLSSCFAHYEQRPSPFAAQVAASTPRLQQRDVARGRRLWPYLWPFGKRWRRIWTFYTRSPTLLKSNEVEEPTTDLSQRPTFLSQRLPFDDETWQVRKRGLPVSATLNTLLLASMFQAIGRWNDVQCAWDAGRPWIRLAVPIDLGTEDDRRALAANYTSLVFLDRRSDQVHSFTELLSSIHKEMQMVKQHQLGFVLLDVLRVLDRIPGGMKAVVKSADCMTTTTLSNLGALKWFLPHEDQISVAEACVREFDVLVPIRPAGAPLFGVITYGGRLHITMNYDQQRFSASDAAEFLDLLCSIVNDNLTGQAK